MMWSDWLIEHVPALRAAADRRYSAGLLSEAVDSGARSVASLAEALCPPPSAGIDDTDRRAKHAARMAEAMEKDSAAKYRGRP